MVSSWVTYIVVVVDIIGVCSVVVGGAMSVVAFGWSISIVFLIFVGITLTVDCDASVIIVIIIVLRVTIIVIMFNKSHWLVSIWLIEWIVF